MDFSDFEWAVQSKLKELINSMTKAKAEEFNLDRRAGYHLYVCADCIAVSLNDDSFLQYYGGFEYVDSSCRKEYGDFVFYTNEDDRVADCLQHYYFHLNQHESVDNQKEVA